MAVTATPVFTQTPKHAVLVNTTASAGNRDGTGTASGSLTAGSNGCRILTITVTASASTAAGMVRIFVDPTGSSFTNTLFDEIPVPVISASATVPAFRKVLTYDNLLLPAGGKLMFQIEGAEDFVMHVDYGDF